MQKGLLTAQGVRHRVAIRSRTRRRCDLRAAKDGMTEGTTVRAAKHWNVLNDPCHIWATGDKSVRVQNYGGDVSLEKYMTLPVQQYYVLDPHLITSLGDDSFEFSIPKMQLFNEWIQPNVTAKVRVSPTNVHIITTKCSMDVSEMIESLKLDEQWYMIFESTLTWDNNCSNGNQQPRGFQRTLTDVNGMSTAGTTYGMMHGRSRVDVWCELAPGFTFMPRDVLQNACNLAMNTLMQGLLPLFMTQLSDDYKKWATNKEYREERKSWNVERFRQKAL